MMARSQTFHNDIHAIITKALASYYENKAQDLGLKNPQSGSISFVQMCGTALNLNPHYHIIAVDGVWFMNSAGVLAYRNIDEPIDAELNAVIATAKDNVVAYLQMIGIIDYEHHWIDVSEEEALGKGIDLAEIQQASIYGQTLFGPARRVKVQEIAKGFGLAGEKPRKRSRLCVEQNGFTLHAATCVRAHDTEGRQRLIGYVTRPPIANERLSSTVDGMIHYVFKRAYSDGTNAITLHPLDFLARIAAMIPPPWVNLIRYNGVFAPAAKIRDQVIKDAGYRKKPVPAPAEDAEAEIKSQRYTWAFLMGRTFNLNMDLCQKCGGQMRVLAQIRNPDEISRILKHTGLWSERSEPPDQHARDGPSQSYEFAFAD